MPRLSPFAALRFTNLAGKLEDVIAPPYDVIDETLAEELRSRNPHNAVRLVLPKGSEDVRYSSAARTLDSWKTAGVVATDASPGVYVYRQDYEYEGTAISRHALFAALDLVPLDGGEVLPHERTHAGPKRDRLALTLATNTQLSPVFMAGRDPEGTFLSTLQTATKEEAPDVMGRTPDGIRHTLWQVVGDSAADLCDLVGRQPLLIADGHHRYETALEASRKLNSEAARRMLVCVVSEADPGLIIQPTHRTLTRLPQLSGTSMQELLTTWFEIRPLDTESPTDAAAQIATKPSGLVMVVNGETMALTTRQPVGGGPQDPASTIAAVQFDRHVVAGLLDTDADRAAHDGILEYHRDPRDAVQRAGTQGAAFLLPPVSLEAVWKATAAGFRLPPKSTYFEPKMPSGLLFRPL